jgi:exopolyphosphatase/guanosine-5'-triphosphate,3'-diphosphate pyrophosphatase
MDKFAVLDIGSNTVRLVVYENLTRSPYVIFNEKVICALGRGVSVTGLLMEEPMDKALATMKRFAILIDEMEVTNIRAVATSAVRDAKNGKEFTQLVFEECGIKIDIISGDEEARLSALGILFAIPEAAGIIGDLGGGSLELIHIDNGAPAELVSLKLGPLQFQNKEGEALGFAKDEIQKSPKEKIKESLNGVSWLKGKKHMNFYAVGGAWRTFAKIHMLEHKYPHNNVHHYRISLEEALQLSKKISKMSYLELRAYLIDVSRRRLKVLSLAALVLHRILKKLKPHEIIISASGLREGIIYNAMRPEVRTQDVLIEDCKSIAKMTGRFPEHGERLSKFIAPLFQNETAHEVRLRLAVCILSDVGWRGLAEYRAAKVLSEVLYGRLSGLDHAGMGFVGLSLYVCYGGKVSDIEAAVAKSFLSDEEISRAKRVGLALRLAQRLSGGTVRGVKISELEIKRGKLILSISKDKAAVYNEVVGRRLASLAKACEYEEIVEYYE